MSRQKMFLPTFISNAEFQSARVRPRVFFYNGKVETTPYNVSGYNTIVGNAASTTIEPEFPDAGSESTLFFNETPVYGTAPIQSLYTKYWSKYITLLYDPKTRLIDCSAVLPFADYIKLNLNDIIVWRSNHYHLRAINKYNLTTGECAIQLLGPIIDDALDNQFT